MKKIICTILSAISTVLSILSFTAAVGSLGLFFLAGILGTLISGKLFYVINGAEGPIPTTGPIFQTDFVWLLIWGIGLLAVGFVLWAIRKISLRCTAPCNR